MTVVIIDYGGTIVSLKTPDREGQLENVVLGYPALADYEAGGSYLGALIGRYGNRISKAQFELDGKIYKLAANAGQNHLHGGERGFDRIVWKAVASTTPNGPTLLLSHESKDGEEGYPGKLVVTVRYTLHDDNRLVIEYTASTDKATPLNLTSHSYFNLCGDVRRDVLGHRLQIFADHFTPVDNTLIPTGEYRPVEGTPFDFRSAKTVGADIGADDKQIAFGGGFDHNWVVNRQADGSLRHIANLSESRSGRVMQVHSSEPGVQFYTGNFLGAALSEQGVVNANRHGLCLETQQYPDSPNQANFPSTILRPGEKFKSQTIYAFSTDNGAA